MVRAAVAAVRGCAPYRAAVERNASVIYQPLRWPSAWDEMADEILGAQPDALTVARKRRFAEDNAVYSPLVRCALSGRHRRIAPVDRRYFAGKEDWLPVE